MAVFLSNPDSATFFYTGSAILSAPPISFYAEFEPSIISVAPEALIEIVNRPPGFGGTEYFGLFLSGNQFGPPVVSVGKGHFVFNDRADAPGNYVTGSFQTAGGVIASSTSMKAYLNGVPGAVNAADHGAPVGMNDTFLGSEPTSTVGTFFGGFNGCFRKLAIWQSALSDANMVSLNGGTDPTAIDPGNLVGYWKMLTAASALVATVGPGLTLNIGTGSMVDCGGLAGGSAAYVHIVGC